MELDIDYDDQIKGATEVGKYYGEPERPKGLASGWYPFVIKKAEVGKNQFTQVAEASVQLGIPDEGAALGLGKRLAFVDIPLGAAMTYNEWSDGKKGDEKVRTPEEFKKALEKAQGFANALLAAIGVTHNPNPMAEKNSPARVGEFYNVEKWATSGQVFMGRLVRNAKGYNALREIAPVNDDKHGMTWWASHKDGMVKTKAELDKLAAKGDTTPSNGKGGSVAPSNVAL